MQARTCSLLQQASGRDTPGVAAVRLRILSDLHFAEPASRIRDLRMLAPLLEGPEKLVFNGDSIDTRFLETDRAAAAGREAFFEFIEPYRSRLTLVTGNHDPDISPHHHLEVDGGRVLITHGDVLFPSVAPWGWEAPHVLAARSRRLAEIDATRHAAFETQLEVCKYSSYATRHLSPSGQHTRGGTLARLFHLVARVRRADKIVTSWFHSPTLAAELAARYRPEARVIIFGHTHWPGVWRRGPRILINTGAFTPPLGARLIDFAGEWIEVRSVLRTGAVFRPGPLLARLRASPAD